MIRADRIPDAKDVITSDMGIRYRGGPGRPGNEETKLLGNPFVYSTLLFYSVFPPMPPMATTNDRSVQGSLSKLYHSFLFSPSYKAFAPFCTLHHMSF